MDCVIQDIIAKKEQEFQIQLMEQLVEFVK